jgi:hypothetical protein
MLTDPARMYFLIDLCLAQFHGRGLLISPHWCPHCGDLNVFPGFDSIFAYGLTAAAGRDSFRRPYKPSFAPALSWNSEPSRM